jgi:hypothetical protein
MKQFTNAGRFGHFLSIPRNMPARMNLLLDAPDQEFWLDETNRGTTIVPAFANAYIWATTNHRVAFSEPYLMTHGNPYGRDSFPPQEILRRMLLALTYGASPSIAVAQPKNLQQELYNCMDEVQRRKPWLTHKSPEPWAALVMSDNTRNFYGRSPGLVEKRYMASVFGVFRTAVEEHLPVTVINDWNLNAAELARHKVLILPNTACLDDAQVTAIEGFVKQGGGLVASLDTSLFDEYGDPRANFALGDVLGIDYRGLPVVPAGKDEIDVNFATSIGPDYWEKRKNIFDFKQDPASFLNKGKMKAYVGDQAVTFKGGAVRVGVKDKTAKVLGTLRARSVSGGSEFPGIIAHSYGKGRVVYFAGGFDSAYYLYSYPYQRLALRHAITWAASAPQPVVIDAPMCVHATLMGQKKGGAERLIVHLFSDLNTTAFHAQPKDDVPLREEVVPIHDIQITLRPEYHIRKIHLEHSGDAGFWSLAAVPGEDSTTNLGFCDMDWLFRLPASFATVLLSRHARFRAGPFPVACAAKRRSYPFAKYSGEDRTIASRERKSADELTSALVSAVPGTRCRNVSNKASTVSARFSADCVKPLAIPPRPSC